MGPKKIKLFANQPQTITFDQAETMAGSQEFELVSIVELILKSIHSFDGNYRCP